MKDYCGIYVIINTVNNKRYVGSSKRIKRRLSEHKHSLLRGVHHNDHLQKSFNKYGRTAFKISIVEECDRDQLFIRERYWMEYYGTGNPEYGYNLSIVTEIGGYELTEDQRERRRQATLKQRLNDRYIVINANNFTQKKIFTKAELIQKGYSNEQIIKSMDNNKIVEGVYIFAYETYTGCKLLERYLCTIPYPNTELQGKAVYVYDGDLNPIHKFNSIGEAAKAFELTPRAISKAIKVNTRINREYYVFNNVLDHITMTSIKQKQKQKRIKTGGRTKRKVKINNQIFDSIEIASKILEIPVPTLYAQLHTSNNINAQYIRQ